MPTCIARFAVVAWLSLLPATAVALTLPVQGRLATVAGGPVTDGVYPLQLRLYASADAQEALWAETWIGVPVAQGLFALELGGADVKKNPLPEALFVQQPGLWLGVQVSIEPELPRVRLGTVPFAVRATYAEQLTQPLPGDQIADGSIAAKTVGFAYAGSASKGGPAADLACTGCVGLDELAPGVLAAGNVAYGQGTVGQRLDELAPLKAKGSQVGIGKSPAGTCALDVASDEGPVCVDGEPALLVRTATSAEQMGKYGKPGQIVFRADEGKAYLFVNGAWRQMQLVASCGDGAIDPPETCDDKNDVTTDGCVQCQKAACGDGFVQADVEGCDDGNQDPTDACVACQKAQCGDGHIFQGTEVCDGTDVGTATCTSLLGAGWTGTVGCGAGCTKLDTAACKGPLGTQGNPAQDCKAILAAVPGTASGAYWLQNGANPALQAYCDMTTDGGGWTLVTSWPFAAPPGVWGSASKLVADPKPTVQHALPFVTTVPAPTAVRFVYQGNGQSFSDKVAAGAQWETSAGNGTRIKVQSGYVVWEQGLANCTSSTDGAGLCLVNGTYGNGFNCDGNSGQVNGKGLFNECAYDELSGCSDFAWKTTSNNAAEVCKPTGLVSIFLR